MPSEIKVSLMVIKTNRNGVVPRVSLRKPA